MLFYCMLQRIVSSSTECAGEREMRIFHTTNEFRREPCAFAYRRIVVIVLR